MSYQRYEPFALLQRVQNTLNRAIEDSGFGNNLDATRGTSWIPSVDVYEDPERLVFRFEVPGVLKEDIQVRFENQVLTVEGSRKLEYENKRNNYHRIERTHGRFARSFSLPPTVAGDSIQAELKDGVLSLSLPKRPEAQPRTIEIKG